MVRKYLHDAAGSHAGRIFTYAGPAVDLSPRQPLMTSFVSPHNELPSALLVAEGFNPDGEIVINTGTREDFS
jgi:hypothetical protein